MMFGKETRCPHCNGVEGARARLPVALRDAVAAVADLAKETARTEGGWAGRWYHRRGAPGGGRGGGGRAPATEPMLQIKTEQICAVFIVLCHKVYGWVVMNPGGH